MSRRILRIAAPAVTLLSLAACAQDPFVRPDTWRATGVNERNLRAMIANPADLTRGTGSATERGDAGSTAVTRLVTERRRPLPVSPTSSLGGAEQPGADTPTPGLGIATGGGGGGGGATGGGAL